MFGFLTAPCSACSSREHSVYRAHFCGLCNRLRRDYGLPMRFLVNRDATFLSLLGNALSSREVYPEKATCCNPLGKPRLLVQEGDPVSYAAAITICGLKTKLDDEVADRRNWFAGLPVRGMRDLLSRPVEKAEGYLKQRGFPLDEVQESLGEQILIEKNLSRCLCPDLDDLSHPSAFSFGKILAHTGDTARETLEQIGQSLGRVIYTMDAVVDRERDRRSGQFNPFLLQPTLIQGVTEMIDQEMHTVSGALQDLPLFRHRELMELILGRNLQRTCNSILTGNAPLPKVSNNNKRHKRNKSNGPCSFCDGFNVCDFIYCCDCGNSSDCDCTGGCCDSGCECDICCCDCS